MRETTEDTAVARPAPYVVLCTVPDAATGDALARSLVEAKLAACVNRVPGLVSIYRWEGETREDREELLVVKTDEDRLSRVVAAIEAEHPYDCPEALAIPVAGGSLPYLNWIGTSLA